MMTDPGPKPKIWYEFGHISVLWSRDRWWQILAKLPTSVTGHFPALCYKDRWWQIWLKSLNLSLAIFRHFRFQSQWWNKRLDASWSVGSGSWFLSRWVAFDMLIILGGLANTNWCMWPLFSNSAGEVVDAEPLKMVCPCLSFRRRRLAWRITVHRHSQNIFGGLSTRILGCFFLLGFAFSQLGTRLRKKKMFAILEFNFWVFLCGGVPRLTNAPDTCFFDT